MMTAAILALSALLEAPDRARLGGPATVDAMGPHAFSLPVPGLSREDRRAFSVGNSFFRDNWVVAPASAAGRDGLGPLFNANSCSACHADDGRGRPPLAAGDVGVGAVVFISPRDADGAPHPVYGAQIQDQAIPGVAPEAALVLEERMEPGRYTDGASYELARIVPTLARPAYGPLGELRLSLRIGPQLIGGGLLEAVDDATILAMADPDDVDGDGISGRAHLVAGSEPRVGRFGWKASQPTLDAQVMAALHEDMGLTNPAHMAEPTMPTQAIDAPSGGDPATGAPEVDAHKVARLAHYCRVLAVPAQRGAGTPEVERGRALFAEAGCARCHAPTLRTGDRSPIEGLRGVEFHPYTDLLLHDMGDGLADDRRDGDATGREWRTPPLWGLGLIETVNGHTRLLHDGRARSIEEAVLWHGGEAQRARDAFVAMPAAERAALLAFLRSL
ncbi:MAG: hypothetical protein RI967_1874 [Planctomycetota bacterium]|jgi:CxxC motif-containing protein (DUF1111 family)